MTIIRSNGEDQDNLETIREALQLYHREFLARYGMYMQEAEWNDKLRLQEQKIIRLRDEIDNELESLNKKNNPT